MFKTEYDNTIAILCRESRCRTAVFISLAVTAVMVTGCGSTVVQRGPRRAQVVRRPAPAHPVAVVPPAPAPAQSVIVTVAPPPVKVERRPPRSSNLHVWCAGHWDRRGNTWVWAPGAWTRPPQRGKVWVQSRWSKGPHGWKKVPGRWR